MAETIIPEEEQILTWKKRFTIRNCSECGKPFEPSGTRDVWCSIPCRFWSHVDRSAGPDACWPWKKACFETGYGQFTVEGIPLYAHRMALELTGVKIPDGFYATHGCDNPPCCNPHKDHVRPGSPSQNLIEAISRGRHRPPSIFRGDEWRKKHGCL